MYFHGSNWHCFRKLFNRQWALTWTNVDPDLRHLVASQCHNYLTVDFHSDYDEVVKYGVYIKTSSWSLLRRYLHQPHHCLFWITKIMKTSNHCIHWANLKCHDRFSRTGFNAHISVARPNVDFNVDTMFFIFFVYIVSCKAFKLVQVVCSSAS